MVVVVRRTDGRTDGGPFVVVFGTHGRLYVGGAGRGANQLGGQPQAQSSYAWLDPFEFSRSLDVREQSHGKLSPHPKEEFRASNNSNQQVKGCDYHSECGGGDAIAWSIFK